MPKTLLPSSSVPEVSTEVGIADSDQQRFDHVQNEARMDVVGTPAEVDTDDGISAPLLDESQNVEVAVELDETEPDIGPDIPPPMQVQ